MSAGRNENVGAGKFLRQDGAQPLDVVGGRLVIFLQADERVAVLRADGAGVLIGHVDAGERQADIVDDIVELIGRNDAAHGLFDQIEQARGLLDAGAGLGADVHQDLPGIDRREEVLAQKRPEAEGDHDARQEAADEGLRAAKRQRQQRAIAVAEARERSLETLLKSLERIAGAWRRLRWIVRSGMMMAAA